MALDLTLGGRLGRPERPREFLAGYGRFGPACLLDSVLWVTAVPSSLLAKRIDES